MTAATTALQKLDGGVRGIAIGTSFHRLVARILARQFGKAVESILCPVPVRLVHTSWHRLRGSCCPFVDGREPHGDGSVH